MTLDQEGITQNILALHSSSMQLDFRRAALWEWLRKRINPTSRVLDAGCGTGYMLLKLIQAGHSAVGLEYETKLAEFAREQLKAIEANCQVHNMGLGQGTAHSLGQFDHILCLDVLEHIEDDLKALKELQSILKPSGSILISLPALPSLYGQRDRKLGHYRRYNKAMLSKLIAEAGLRASELRYWNAVGVPPYFFFERILKKPINDGLRQQEKTGIKSALKGTLRSMLYYTLCLEGYLDLGLPFGLSVLAVCRKKD